MKAVKGHVLLNFPDLPTTKSDGLFKTESTLLGEQEFGEPETSHWIH